MISYGMERNDVIRYGVIVYDVTWVDIVLGLPCRSVESFERKMDETQRALGRDPQDFVPVVYQADSELMKDMLQ